MYNNNSSTLLYTLIIALVLLAAQLAPAEPVPASIIANTSAFQFLLPNESICGGVAYNGKAFFAVNSFSWTVANTSALTALIVEVDIATLTRTGKTYNKFTKRNPCTLSVSSNGLHLYAATDSAAGGTEIHMIEISTFSKIWSSNAPSTSDARYHASAIIDDGHIDASGSAQPRRLFIGGRGIPGSSAPFLYYYRIEGPGLPYYENRQAESSGDYDITSFATAGKYLYYAVKNTGGRRHAIKKFDMESTSLTSTWDLGFGTNNLASLFVAGGLYLFARFAGSSAGTVMLNIQGTSLVAVAQGGNARGAAIGPNSAVAFDGRYAYSHTDQPGISSINPTNTLNEIFNSGMMAGAGSFDTERGVAAFVDARNNNNAYFVFSRQLSNQSYVISALRSATPDLVYESVLSVTGDRFEATNTRDTYEGAKARCAAKMMAGTAAAAAAAATLAVPDSADKNSALRHAMGEWASAFVGGRATNSDFNSRLYYYSWEGDISNSFVRFNDFSGGQTKQTTGSYYENFAAGVAADYGDCVAVSRLPDASGNSWTLRLCNDSSESVTALCQWRPANTTSETLSAAVQAGDRYFEVSTKSRSHNAPPAFDYKTNELWEFRGSYFEKFPHLHSTVPDTARVSGVSCTPAEFAVLESKYILAVCSSGTSYAIRIATNARIDLVGVGSPRSGHTSFKSFPEFRAVVLLGSSGAFAYSVDTVSGDLITIWQSPEDGCFGAVMQTLKGTSSGGGGAGGGGGQKKHRFTAWCGSGSQIHSFYFFQHPTSGRLTRYGETELLQPGRFNTPQRKAVTLRASDGATIITGYSSSLPSTTQGMPIAFDTVGAPDATFCQSICRDLASVTTSTCSLSLVPLAKNETCVRFWMDIFKSRVDFVYSARAAAVSCVGGTAYTNPVRVETLDKFIAVSATLEINATGQHIVNGSNSATDWPTVQRAVAFASKNDDHLVGFAVEYRGGRCTNVNAPETWFNSDMSLWRNEALFANFDVRRDPYLQDSNDLVCHFSTIFYYNITARSETAPLVWQKSFAGSFQLMPNTPGDDVSEYYDAIFGARLSLARRKDSSSGNGGGAGVFYDTGTTFYTEPVAERAAEHHAPLFFFGRASGGKVNESTMAGRSYVAVTKDRVRLLRTPEPALPGVVDEMSVFVESADWAEEMHVVRCGAPVSGKVFFKIDKSWPHAGAMGIGDMPAVSAAVFEPDFGAGGAFYDKSTNAFAIVNVPCPGGNEPTRFDIVINFTAAAATQQVLRIPFVVIAPETRVPPHYPNLPATTAPPVTAAPPQVTSGAIVTLPEYPSTVGNPSLPAPGFTSAATVEAAAAALAASAPPAAGPYSLKVELKSPLLGWLQANRSVAALAAGITFTTSADRTSVTLSGTSPAALASALSGGVAALFMPNPDVATFRMLSKRYVQLTLTNAASSAAVLSLPLNSIKEQTGPMVNAGPAAACAAVAVPQGSTSYFRFEFEFGPLFSHPQRMPMSWSRAVVTTAQFPDSMRFWCHAHNFSCAATGTFASSKTVAITFNASDGVFWKTVTCSVEPQWRALAAVRPVLQPVRVKAQSPVVYFVPQDIFESSDTRVAYKRAISPLVTSGDLVFDAPNVLRGAFPDIGNFSVSIEAEDSFNVRTTAITFTAGNVGPVVFLNGDNSAPGAGIALIPALSAHRVFNITLPVPCVDPDGDALRVSMVKPPPVWMSWRLLPGGWSRAPHVLYLFGAPDTAALKTTSSFELRCEDAFYNVTYTQTVEVLDSLAPVFTSAIGLPNATVVVGQSAVISFDVWDFWTDPDASDHFNIQYEIPTATAAKIKSISVIVTSPPRASSSSSSSSSSALVSAITAGNSQQQQQQQQNSERVAVTVEIPSEAAGWAEPNDSVFTVVTFWAVDEFGKRSATRHSVVVKVPWTMWMELKAAHIIPIGCAAAAVLVVALLVCFYPCILNHVYRRRASRMPCPITREKSTWQLPDNTAELDIRIRRVGCVWPIWILSDYAYDVWTLKPLPGGQKAPEWLELGDDTVTFKPLEEKGNRVSALTETVEVRCFTGGGLVITHFDASYNKILGDVDAVPVLQQPLLGETNKRVTIEAPKQQQQQQQQQQEMALKTTTTVTAAQEEARYRSNAPVPKAAALNLTYSPSGLTPEMSPPRNDIEDEFEADL